MPSPFRNPLADTMDTLRASVNPLAGLFPQSPAAYRQPLPQSEADSLGQRLINGGLSGLGYVASVLDKPGRAVRGVLGGRPGEALAALPFSDSLGITDPTNAVSGADLLDKAGVTDPKNDSWGRYLGGIGVELATDPLSYLGGVGVKNALTKTGSALEKAGALKGVTRTQLAQGVEGLESAASAAGKLDEFGHLRKAGHFMGTSAMEAAASAAGSPLLPNQPLAGLAKIGLPVLSNFGVGPMATVGTSLAPKVAPVLDKLGAAALYSRPGIALSAALSPRAMDAVHAPTQQAARAVGYETMKAADRAGTDAAWVIRKGLEDFKKANPHIPPEEIDRAALAVGEMGRGSSALGVDQGLAAQLRAVVQPARGYYDNALRQGQEIGMKISKLEDPYSSFMHRTLAEVPPAAGRRADDTAGRIFGTGDSFSRARELPRLPGGATLINKFAMDPRFAKAAGAGQIGRRAGARAIAKDVRAVLAEQGAAAPAKLPKRPAGMRGNPGATKAYIAGLTPAQKEAWDLRQGALKLSKYLRGRAEAGPLLSTDIAGSLTDYAGKFARRQGQTDAILHAMAKGARAAEPGDVPVLEAARKLGLKTTWGDPATGALTQGAAPELWQRMFDLHGQTVGAHLPGTHSDWAQAFGGLGVKPDVFQALAHQYGRPRTTTEQIAGPLRALAGYTNLAKNALYSYWFPSHARNLMSGEWTNLTEGVNLADRVNAYKLLRGYHPEQERFARMFSGQGGVFSGVNQTTDLANSLGAVASRVPGMPEVTGRTLLGDAASEAGAALKATAKDPLGVFTKMRGVGSTQQDNPLLGTMKHLGTEVEDYLRSSHMFSSLRKGFSPEMAADRMLKAHFDYSPRAATTVERNYIKPMYPFYTFMSRNLPYQIGKLTGNPGLVAQELRAMTPRGTGYTPEHLRSGVAIPLGQEQDGKQQFLGSLGLPLEEAFDRLTMKNGRPDVAATAMKYLAGVNPLLLGPLQWMTNKQFYSGRNLSDLKAPLGLSDHLNPDAASTVGSAIAMSPLSRVITTVDRLADPRKTWWQKALNVGTGVRVTDVDMEQARAIETRNKLADLMRTQPHLAQYVDIYPRKGERSNLTEDEITQLRMMAYLQQRARQAAGSGRSW